MLAIHLGSRSSSGNAEPSSSTLPRASPRKTAWLLLKDPEDAQPYLDEPYYSFHVSAVNGSSLSSARASRQVG
jgi:hypothetical protein